MNDLTFPIIFMLIMVTLEGLYLEFKRHIVVDWHDISFNLNSGHIMLWLFRGLEIFCYGWIAHHFSLNLLKNWHPAWVWVFAIIAWDFGFYWLHRLHHKIPVLWAIHKVHHQGEQFNLSLAVRNSWYSSLSSIPFFALLAIIGVPLPVFIAVSILHYSIQFFNHSAVIPRLGILERILVTPLHHKVHHVKDFYYSNRNFGGSFIIWDKLFGSFEKLPPNYNIGIGGPASSNNPVTASNAPFLALFNIQLPQSTPIRRFTVNNFLITSATLLLFGWVISYVYFYGYGYDGNTSLPQVVLFLLLVIGTVAIAGLTDGKRWGLALWMILAISFPLIFVLLWQWTSLVFLLLSIALLVHASALSLGYGRNPYACA
ncbi:sterol desaturase family protein [Pseudomonas sp. F1_0610]|uniref:sterol desaturase family protein n=1 Tax=Pseudomonas sp. F1_0610 TaxID=3114284 RepID=UPI0039C49637